MYKNTNDEIDVVLQQKYRGIMDASRTRQTTISKSVKHRSKIHDSDQRKDLILSPSHENISVVSVEIIRRLPQGIEVFINQNVVKGGIISSFIR